METTEEAPGFLKRCYEAVRIRYRFLAYGIMFMVTLTDTNSRFGISLAMIGGMVKKNCTDSTDMGSYCWSENQKATLLGAFYYGYAAQMLPTAIARRVGFTVMIRFSVLIAAVIQLTFPLCAEQSVQLTIALQVLRGAFAGILMSNNMEFARKWALGNEGKKFISALGFMLLLGMGSGPWLAGLVTTRIGWRYYFYINGVAYVIVLLLLVGFVPDAPLDTWAMSDEEKLFFRRKTEKTLKKTTNGKRMGPTAFKKLFSRSYVWAFCIYMFCTVYTFSTGLSTSPFYFDEVLGASSDFISFLQLGIGITGAFSAYLFSVVLVHLDKKLPWKNCRIILCLGPMVVSIVLFMILPHLEGIVFPSAILLLNQFSKGTMFSGSLMTINFEIDPQNAAMIVGIFNGFGQTSSFINPIVMAELTGINKTLPNYSSIHHQRWAYFFYINAGVSLVAIGAIVASLMFRPSEWRKYQPVEEIDSPDVLVIENAATKE